MITKEIKSDLLKIRGELERVAGKYSEWMNGNLCGACAISALLTYRYFKKKGYNPKFLYGDHHCLITVEDYFVDLTATQFDNTNPEVLVDDIACLGDYYDLEHNKFRTWKKPVSVAFPVIWAGQHPYVVLKKFRRLKSIV